MMVARDGVGQFCRLCLQ